MSSRRKVQMKELVARVDKLEQRSNRDTRFHITHVQHAMCLSNQINAVEVKVDKLEPRVDVLEQQYKDLAVYHAAVSQRDLDRSVQGFTDAHIREERRGRRQQERNHKKFMVRYITVFALVIILATLLRVVVV